MSNEIVLLKARKYAFETLTCPETNCTVDEALEAWGSGALEPNGKIVEIWQPFENHSTDELIEAFDNFVDTFVNFNKELMTDCFCEAEENGVPCKKSCAYDPEVCLCKEHKEKTENWISDKKNDEPN